MGLTQENAGLMTPDESGQPEIKRPDRFRKPSLYPAELRELGESLLAGVHANKCARSIAGVDSAVGKNGDGPAAALEDLGLDSGDKVLGRGGAEGEFAFFAKDEQLVLHGH